MIYIKLTILSLIICYVIGYSGIIESLDWGLQKWLGSPLYHVPKPFNCERCSIFWCGLLLCLIMGEITWWSISYVFLLSFLNIQLSSLLFLFQGIVEKVLDYIALIFNLK